MIDSNKQEEQKKQDDPQEKEPFTDVFFQAVLGAQLLQTAYIGHALGWYTALAASPRGLTVMELATTTRTSPRYAQEWLEQQTVAGWMKCKNPSAASNERVFYLSESHVSVLANPDSLHYGMQPLAVLHGGTGMKLKDLVQAYRDDTGVSWNDIGNDAREAQAAMNRPFFLQQFGKTLEECLDDKTVKKLKNNARVADIGCGYAYSSIGVAKDFTNCTVDAYDLDEPSILKARQIILENGLENRVKAHCIDAASVISSKSFQHYDLVMALECIHDMANPISVLSTMKRLAGTDGTVLVMDERVADSFEQGIGNPVEQTMYGFSCTCCLADCKSHVNSAETGTVMRPSCLRLYAQQAGFRELEILPVQHDFFYFYQLLQ
jgi:predicted O-methyltransferase YrrM